jgi:hypothetical protein
MNISSDGTVDSRPCAVQVRQALKWPLLDGDWMFPLLRRLTVTLQAIRLSRPHIVDVHVAPMNAAWLERHERDYDKLGAPF